MIFELVWLIIAFGLINIWIIRRVVRKLRAHKGVENLRLYDLPLSPQQWERFAALAIAKDWSQKRLVAEAIKDYLEQKTR